MQLITKPTQFLRYQADQFRNAMDPVKGKSYQQVARRVQEAIYRIIEQSEGKEVVIITHGGAMRSLQMMHLHSEVNPAHGSKSQA